LKTIKRLNEYSRQTQYSH